MAVVRDTRNRRLSEGEAKKTRWNRGEHWKHLPKKGNCPKIKNVIGKSMTRGVNTVRVGGKGSRGESKVEMMG